MPTGSAGTMLPLYGYYLIPDRLAHDGAKLTRAEALQFAHKRREGAEIALCAEPEKWIRPRGFSRFGIERAVLLARRRQCLTGFIARGFKSDPRWVSAHVVPSSSTNRWRRRHPASK